MECVWRWRKNIVVCLLLLFFFFFEEYQNVIYFILENERDYEGYFWVGYESPSRARAAEPELPS